MTLTDFNLSNVAIRHAEPADHEAVRTLFDEGMLEGQLRANDTGADIDNLQEAYFLDEGASAFWVASHGDEILGMIGVQKTSDNTAEMRRLRVRSDCRRRGVGTLLMEHATEFCRTRGYLKVTLDVRVDRGPAIAMFEKFGFKLARTREIGEQKLLDFYIDLYSEPRG